MNIRNLTLNLLKSFPSLHGALIALRDQKNIQIPAQETPFGFKFAGPPSMITGKFEQHEAPMIRRLIARNDLFVNIGANVGYYCCFAGKAGKPVIAFEPHAVNCRLLLRNLEMNGYSGNAEIYPTAVGAKNGILKLFGSGTAASLVDGWAGIPSENFAIVPVITLDGVLSGRFENQSILVLIDVEGAELSVLQGAVNTLKRIKKPWWVIEICTTEHQPAGVSINPNFLPTFNLIDSAGYEVWTLDDKPRKVGIEEITTIHATGNDTLGIHNFLCVEPSAVIVALESLAGD